EREEAREYIIAILNSLDPSAEDAKTMFKRAENEINTMAEKLGDEYHQKFMMTLNDMRPEFE
ncbi:TPA: recombinase RecT, partial [Escherichia coli O25b:H4-ST131]|nr:recombinase RecT [Escherichia coli O25b:H4-ST131]